MNQSVYTYCLLQYRHSQLLEEVLNVGLLAYFPNIRKLIFIYPHNLKRITDVYPDVQEKTIRAYLKSFSLRVKELNQSPEAFAQVELDTSFVQFTSRQLLPPDSSALQFSRPRRGLADSEEADLLVKRLYQLYLSFYETDPTISTRTDDVQLATRYKKMIRDIERELGKPLSKELASRMHFDYDLIPNESEIYSFDAAWQNGTFNLVKSVSFDISRADVIQNKALRYYGQSIRLENIAAQRNLRFDLLIAKPKKPELFKYFDSAVHLLSGSPNVQLVFEEQLKDYSEKTVAAINDDVEQ